MSRPSHQWDTSKVKHMKIEEEPTVAASSLPMIVDPSEAERIIEGLKKFPLEDVGSTAWMDQHRKIERLNLQAHQNAISNSDEFIMETILTFDKLSFLFYDLLLIEAWKENVYPLLVNELAGRNNMRLYFILYHEATLVNLLEVFFYYKHTVESGHDHLLDMVDYLGRKLTRLNQLNHKFRELNLKDSFLNNNNNKASSNTNNNTTTDITEKAKAYAQSLQERSPMEELSEHYLEIEFRVCLSSLTLARFLIEHCDPTSFPLSVLSRITDTHDYLLLLIPLLENPPWTRRLSSTGQWQKMIDYRWQMVQPLDLLKVTKLEGQAWIAIYQFLAKDCIRERYQLNTFRKGQLLRLRKYLNEIMLDQLPFLADIQRYMDELTVTNVPEMNAQESNSVFLFQQVAVVTESISKGKDYQKVKEIQLINVFTMTDKNDSDLLKMAQLYSEEGIEDILEYGQGTTAKVEEEEEEEEK